jgi:lysophospholipase L1-like esterase
MRYQIFLLFILVSFGSIAQKPFENEINAFKKQDSLQFPGTGKILFVGSSSFRLWKDLQGDFPKHPLINRGFGGSTFKEILLYKDEIIRPYAPKQIVIYCGENDLAGGASTLEVFNNFKALFGYIRGFSPKTSIVFVSIKPSPSRKHIFEKVKEANTLIRNYIGKQKLTVFVDTFSLMLDSDGNFKEELFVEDRLHMNRKGYDIWKAALEPHLK